MLAHIGSSASVGTVFSVQLLGEGEFSRDRIRTSLPILPEYFCCEKKFSQFFSGMRTQSEMKAQNDLFSKKKNKTKQKTR